LQIEWKDPQFIDEAEEIGGGGVVKFELQLLEYQGFQKVEKMA
jgi:hypothetical protein